MPVFIVQHWGPFPNVFEVEKAMGGGANNISIVSSVDAFEANTIAWNYACSQYCQRRGEPFRLLPCHLTINAVPADVSFVIMKPEISARFSTEDIAEMRPGNGDTKILENLKSDHSLVVTSYWKVDLTKPPGTVPALPIESNLFGACLNESRKAAAMANNNSVIAEGDGSGTMTRHDEVVGSAIVWNPSNAGKILDDLGISNRPAK